MSTTSPSHAAFHRLLVRSATVPVVAVTVLAGVFLAQVVYLLSAARRVDHTNQVIAEANQLLRLLVDGETGVRGYLITGDPAFLEPYHAEEADAGREFQELVELVSDNPAQVARLEALRRNHADWQAFARRMVDIRRDGGNYEFPVRSGEGKRRMDAMRAQVAEFIRVEEELRDLRTAAVRRATWVVVGVSLSAAVVLGGLLAAATRRQLTRLAGVYEGTLDTIERQAREAVQAARRLGTLHRLDREILAAASVTDLSRSAAQWVAESLPAGAACVVAYRATTGPALVSSDAAGAGVAAVEAALTGLTGSEPQPDDVQDRLREAGYPAATVTPVESGDTRLGFLVVACRDAAALTPAHQQIAEEVARQLAIGMDQAALRDRIRAHAEELEDRVRERTRDLQAALDSVRQLQGLLPICAWCKKVRDDQDYWHDVEHYVAAHTEARFSHGICPSCFNKHAGGSG